jgi:hypothetical protein
MSECCGKVSAPKDTLAGYREIGGFPLFPSIIGTRPSNLLRRLRPQRKDTVYRPEHGLDAPVLAHPRDMNPFDIQPRFPGRIGFQELIGRNRLLAGEHQDVLSIPEVDPLVVANPGSQGIEKDVAALLEEFAPVRGPLFIDVAGAPCPGIAAESKTTEAAPVSASTTLRPDSGDRCSSTSRQMARSK